jgi:hypothetical protein
MLLNPMMDGLIDIYTVYILQQQQQQQQQQR